MRDVAEKVQARDVFMTEIKRLQVGAVFEHFQFIAVDGKLVAHARGDEVRIVRAQGEFGKVYAPDEPDILMPVVERGHILVGYAAVAQHDLFKQRELAERFLNDGCAGKPHAYAAEVQLESVRRNGLAEKLQLVYGNGAARGADGFDLLRRQAAAGEVDALESRETEKIIAERVHVLRGERLPGKGELLCRRGSGHAEHFHVPAEGKRRKRRGERILHFIGYRAARKGYPVKLGKEGQRFQKLRKRRIGAQHGALRVHRHGLAADSHERGQIKRRIGASQREQRFIIRAAGRIDAFQIRKAGKERNVVRRERREA